MFVCKCYINYENFSTVSVPVSPYCQHFMSSYAWIYLRCFWSTCFLVALYHPIFHIRPSNLACLSLIIFLIFDGFDTLFAYYYLHVDVDSKGDRVINSFIIYESNKHICNIFNCTYFNTYHFVLFVITFPLMNLFGLILSIIYLKCLTITT